MKKKSFINIFLFCIILLSAMGCPTTSGMGDSNEQDRDNRPDWLLSKEEKAILRKRQKSRRRMHISGYDSYNSSDYLPSVIEYDPDECSETEREMERLKNIIEEIRENCRYSMNKYMEMLKKRSYHSDREFFFKDENRAWILGKHEVCSQILTRIEEGED